MIEMTAMTLTPANKALRGLWQLVWLLLFRPTPVPLHRWRAFLLRLFGARLGRGVLVYPSARIWAPWRLAMGDRAVIGPHVECYCVERVELGAGAVVSQFSHLCTASHDYTRRAHPLVAAPITLGEGAWVTTDVFVAPGVTIGERAVVLARSTVLGDVPPWRVWGGYPARDRGERRLDEAVPGSI
jgi:putative colanic acid biosynthesis acetyltransferase WcaF